MSALILMGFLLVLLSFSRLQKGGSKTVKAVRDAVIAVQEVVSAPSSPETPQIQERILTLNRKEQVTVHRIRGTFGLYDDPIDEGIQCFLTLVDTRIVPTTMVFELRDWLWTDFQRWRLVGDGTGVIDVQQNVNQDIEEDLSDEDDYPHTTALYFMMNSSAASAFECALQVDWSVIMTQDWCPDDLTEWNGYEPEEVDHSEMQGVVG